MIGRHDIRTVFGAFLVLSGVLGAVPAAVAQSVDIGRFIDQPNPDQATTLGFNIYGRSFLRASNGERVLALSNAAKRIVAGQTPAQNAAFSAPRVNNPRRVWSAHGAGSEVTATDCTVDCEEDIGIIFMCQGSGRPARVDVPWVALDFARQGERKPLDIVVDGRRFSYTATLGGPGLVGHVPSFTVGPDDPLIEALQVGQVAEVQFSGSGVKIGLRGSRAALDSFKAECPWRAAAAAGQSPADQPLWFASSFTGDNGEPTQSLTFGIPETDATAFNATCVPGEDHATVRLIVDYGGNSSGAIVPAEFYASGETYRYSASVFVMPGGESAGVRLSVALDDPLWQALQGEKQQMVFGVVGMRQAKAAPTGAFGAIGQFVNACRAAAAPAAPQAEPGPPTGQPDTPTAQPKSTSVSKAVRLAVAATMAAVVPKA